jgi:hypothetical protein
MDKGDKTIVPFLIDTLKNSQDAYFKTMAAFVLGILGDKQCVKPLLDYINTDLNNNEIIWAAVPALGLLGDNSKEVITLLNKIAEMKRGTTKTLILLSLYALGDEKASAQLNLKPTREPLKKIEFPAQYFTLKVLKNKGEKEKPILWAIVNNNYLYDTRLRLSAMFHIKFTENDIPELRLLAENTKIPQVIRAYALYHLFLLRDKDVVRFAAEMINKGLPVLMKKKGWKLEGEGFEIVMALRVLGALNAQNVPSIKNIIPEIEKVIKQEKSIEREKVLPISIAPIMETTISELGLINSKEAVSELTKLLNQKGFSLPC